MNYYSTSNPFMYPPLDAITDEEKAGIAPKKNNSLSYINAKYCPSYFTAPTPAAPAGLLTSKLLSSSVSIDYSNQSTKLEKFVPLSNGYQEPNISPDSIFEKKRLPKQLKQSVFSAQLNTGNQHLS